MDGKVMILVIAVVIADLAVNLGSLSSLYQACRTTSGSLLRTLSAIAFVLRQPEASRVLPEVAAFPTDNRRTCSVGRFRFRNRVGKSV